MLLSKEALAELRAAMNKGGLCQVTYESGEGGQEMKVTRELYNADYIVSRLLSHIDTIERQLAQQHQQTGEPLFLAWGAHIHGNPPIPLAPVPVTESAATRLCEQFAKDITGDLMETPIRYGSSWKDRGGTSWAWYSPYPPIITPTT